MMDSSYVFFRAQNKCGHVAPTRFFTCTTNTEYATMPCPGLREGLKSMPSYKML